MYTKLKSRFFGGCFYFLLVGIAGAQTSIPYEDLQALTGAATASDDIVLIYDISATPPTRKTIEVSELQIAVDGDPLMQIEVTGTNGTEILTNPSINSIDAGTHNSIIGGGYTSFPNRIQGDDNLRFIFGGYENDIGASIACNIFGSYHSGIMDADASSTEVSRDDTMPGGGATPDTFDGGGHGMIFGGSTNFIHGPAYNIVLGGQFNEILADSANAGTQRYSTFSIIVGGDTNTIDADAHLGVIIGGAHNYIAENIEGATVKGKSGKAYNDSQHVIGNGYFTERGDCQVSTYVLRREIAAGVTESLRGSDSATGEEITADDSGVFKIPDARVITITADIAATTADNAESAGYTYTAVMRSDGATVTILAQTLTTLYEDDAEWVFLAGISGTTVNFNFNGDDAKVTNVTMFLRVTEAGDGS